MEIAIIYVTSNVTEYRYSFVYQLLNTVFFHRKMFNCLLSPTTLVLAGKHSLSIHQTMLDVIYEQRERVFHRDIQTRENNV
jgi:hypothetical protein